MCHKTNKRILSDEKRESKSPHSTHYDFNFVFYFLVVSVIGKKIDRKHSRIVLRLINNKKGIYRGDKYYFWGKWSELVLGFLRKNTVYSFTISQPLPRP